MPLELLNDPASTPLGRRNQLHKISQMKDDELSKLSPDEIRKALAAGADLDSNGKPKTKESSLRIHIELDLEVELHLQAKVTGDITIGLL